jgi:hypothetical protein
MLALTRWLSLLHHVILPSVLAHDKAFGWVTLVPLAAWSFAALRWAVPSRWPLEYPFW